LNHMCKIAYFKNFDIFATPITLSYRGQTGFRSVCGGMMSILLGFLLLFVFIGQFSVFFYTSN